MFNRHYKINNISTNTYTVSNDKIKSRLINIFGIKYEIKHYSKENLTNKFFIFISWLSTFKFNKIFKTINSNNKVNIIYSIIICISLISYAYLLFYFCKIYTINDCIQNGTKCEYINDDCYIEHFNYIEQQSEFYKLVECIYDTYYDEINVKIGCNLIKIVFGHILSFSCLYLIIIMLNIFIKFSIEKYKEYIPDILDIV
jgi:hypothetical protein